MAQNLALSQYAQRNGIVVTDAEIEEKERLLARNYSAASWQRSLAARGLTEQDVSDAIRSQLVLEKAVSAQIVVSDAEARDYFERNASRFDAPATACGRQILVHSLDKAQLVEAALESNKSFADLVDRYSIDDGSIAAHGDLGCFTREQMPAPVSRAAFTLPIGQISAPIRSFYGYHIIQIYRRTPARKATFAGARERVVEEIREQREGPLVQPLLQKILRDSHIVANDPRFADLFL